MNTLSAAITPTRDDYSLPILNENQNRGDMDSHPLGARVRPVSMHRRFFTAAIITVLTAATRQANKRHGKHCGAH